LSALAVIPARGGSKRIPRKNIRPFRGKPMLAWSIEAALASGLFSEVMVSTDDAEIAKVARDFGAVTPFVRSEATASDTATASAVLVEVLGDYARAGRAFETACLLYPTAPFVRTEHLLSGHDLLANGGFDVVLPVARFDYPIWRSLKRDAAGRILLNFPENLNARSQDLPPAYHDAGQWCWFKVAPFLKTRVLMGDNTGSVILPGTAVQDIDDEEDWALAEIKHARLFP
jgi:N-acylneuraminate cytidylyltransferase